MLSNEGLLIICRVWQSDLLYYVSYFRFPRCCYRNSIAAASNPLIANDNETTVKALSIDCLRSYSKLLIQRLSASEFNLLCRISLWIYFRNRKSFVYPQLITKHLTNNTVRLYTLMIAMDSHDSPKKPNKYKLRFSQSSPYNSTLDCVSSQYWNVA